MASTHGTRPPRSGPTALHRGQASRAIEGGAAALALATILIGLPWALVRFIGWPLPRHMPSGSEIADALTSPLSTASVLDLLACILWALWAVFAIDVLRAVAVVVRNLQSQETPKNEEKQGNSRGLAGLAAALVSSLLLSVLSTRATAIASGGPVHRPIPATVSSTMRDLQQTGVKAGHLAAGARTVRVRPPQDGIHDSLWRIADRTLGDGARWPEIYTLNRGRPQPDGGALKNPSLVRPGWILQLPQPPAPPPRHSAQPRHVHTGPPQTSPPSTSPPSTASAPSSPPRSTAATPRAVQPAPGLDLPTGAFVSTGLAAVVAAALLVARRRRRVRYRPGSRDRRDLATAPVVRALRVAHDVEENPEETDSEPDRTVPAGPDAPAPGPVPQGTELGVKDGRLVAWDLARTHGLGLIGPGAYDAARALLVTLLARARDHDDAASARVLMPADDARALLGAELPGIHITGTVDQALEELESELLSRVREAEDGRGTEQGAVVLVATPDSVAEARLQAVLDNGSGYGLAGIVLGQWRPGGTVLVRGDGTVAATSPTVSGLAGTRLFKLPSQDAADLIGLLHESRPSERLGRTEPVRLAPLVPASDEPTEEAGPPPPQISPSQGNGPHADRPLRPWQLSVLGRIRLALGAPAETGTTERLAALAPKHREVLAYLALHADGARREALADAIWPNAPSDRPFNSFHATLSQLRRSLRAVAGDERADLALRGDDGRYVLDHTLVDVDLWRLQAALVLARSAPEASSASVHSVLDLYQGDLAADITSEWIEAPREALRRDVLDLVSAHVHTIRDSSPQDALALLERARSLDPYNEALYRSIARLQAHLGRWDAIPRTLALLTTKLADIAEAPTPATAAFFTALQRPRVGKSPAPAPGS
jgi:DNA-binding SARP family transcriptional activator